MSRYVWLTHVLGKDTPSYAGRTVFRTTSDMSLAAGDKSNSVQLCLSNHLGSHVDAPRHFFPSGAVVSDFSPAEWIFDRPKVIEIKGGTPKRIEPRHLENGVFRGSDDADLLLIKTGMEQFRHRPTYWKDTPVYCPSLHDWVVSRFPCVTAVGLDTISIASPRCEASGIEIHRKLLGDGIRIFEDLHLSHVSTRTPLKQVIALPIIFEESDGAPVTIIAQIE